MSILNERHTAIVEFEIYNPRTADETKGEVLKLSLFGEYCPANSLRGYQLMELICHPQHYAVRTIIQKGVVHRIEPKVKVKTL